ncbi:MAG: CapA family protein [bacterium]|nr:CapA family protein [bacterium]
MQTQNCDSNILLLHWGAEYRIQPNKQQTQLAHTLIEHGADIILGGHSHIPGAIEFYQGKPIFYSFGNFIFDQDRGKKATGKNFDYTYDYELNRKTVATYIPLLAQITLTKSQT